MLTNISKSVLEKAINMDKCRVGSRVLKYPVRSCPWELITERSYEKFLFPFLGLNYLSSSPIRRAIIVESNVKVSLSLRSCLILTDPS